jgi:hypothetical protein
VISPVGLRRTPSSQRTTSRTVAGARETRPAFWRRGCCGRRRGIRFQLRFARPREGVRPAAA